MPKRNLLLLTLIAAISLVAWLARDHGQRGRRIGEVINVVERSALEHVDPDELETAAMEAIVARLDEHSAIIAGSARRELEATLDQQFGGVGLELAATNEGVVVHAPIVGGPAWRAGIAAGDRIVAIDGGSAGGLSVRDAVARLRGDVGSTVSVTVSSPGRATGVDGADNTENGRTVVLAREMVCTESVLGDRRRPDGTWDWCLEAEPGVGFVRITSFGERTAAELDAALVAIAALPDLRGLVIDLRGNPGGLLTAAVEVCDRFLDDGLIVATRRRGGEAAEVVEPRRATAGQVLMDAPIAVLIDGLTASAAEIVAACLQDHARAVVVGSRSFGKGTVQSIIPLSDGRRLLKLTTGEYRRPADEAVGRATGGGSWCVVPDAGREIDVPAEVREAMAAWRRQRDQPPTERVLPVSPSAGEWPRHMDPVLAKALTAFPASPADLSGQKETPGDADQSTGAGDGSPTGDGGDG